MQWRSLVSLWCSQEIASAELCEAARNGLLAYSAVGQPPSQDRSYFHVLQSMHS